MRTDDADPTATFLSALAPQADADTDRIRADGTDPDGLTHRELMRRVLALVGTWTVSDRPRSSPLLAEAGPLVAALARTQGPSGMFIGGDNVDSPPDSAFTLNDLCDAHALLRRAPEDGDAAALADALAAIAAAATPTLLTGGVHTPNHRWEIASALARMHREWPDDRAVARVEEWLGEGPDIDEDGLWSERSAIYAAAVSDPAFIALAEILDRPELLAPVRASLDATLDLMLPDDSVETVHSRRQDQGERFAVGPFAPLLWHLAVLDERADLAVAARRAVRAGVPEAGAVRGRALLHEPLARPLPSVPATGTGERAERPRSRWFRPAGLFIDHRASRTVSVFGGSDVPRTGRIRSGQANSPTILRWVGDGVVLEGVRLSREFFGLGPFRAERMAVRRGDDGETIIRLTERLRAVYHGPLPAAARRPEGDYPLGDEGRFSASMAFPERPQDPRVLETTIDVHVGETVRLDITTSGADVPWALQLTFRSGGAFGDVDVVDGQTTLVRGTGRYRHDGAALAFGPGTGSGPSQRPFYDPGQDYTYLHGTDELPGEHVYLTGRSPGRTTVVIAPDGGVRSSVEV